MIDARSFLLLDVPIRGCLMPASDDQAYERLMGEWATRYRVRLAAVQRLIDAVATIETEEPACPPSP